MIDVNFFSEQDGENRKVAIFSREQYIQIDPKQYLNHRNHDRKSEMEEPITRKLDSADLSKMVDPNSKIRARRK